MGRTRTNKAWRAISGPDSAAYARVEARARLVGILFAVPITIIVFLMVAKSRWW